MSKIIFSIFLSVANFQMCYSQSDTTIYNIVEQMPEFPDGTTAFFKYLSRNLKYPVLLKDNGIDISFFVVSFIIEKNGSINQIESKKYLDHLNEKDRSEFLSTFENMPCWKAGMQNGKPVRVRYSIPIRIRIE